MYFCNTFYLIMFCNTIYSLLNLFKMTSMISNDIQKRLGENLKRIRKSKNLTQFQLAEIADVSEETIKNIELCRCWTSDKNLAKITEALNIDISKLFLLVQSSIQEDSKNIAQIKQTIAEELKSYIETKLNEITR